MPEDAPPMLIPDPSPEPARRTREPKPGGWEAACPPSAEGGSTLRDKKVGPLTTPPDGVTWNELGSLPVLAIVGGGTESGGKAGVPLALAFGLGSEPAGKGGGKRGPGPLAHMGCGPAPWFDAGNSAISGIHLDKDFLSLNIPDESACTSPLGGQD